MELIDRIFYMAIDEANRVPSESINELYMELEETERAGARMCLELEKLCLSEEQREPAAEAFWDATLDYERQGFRNGVRFGVMLYRELLGISGL